MPESRVRKVLGQGAKPGLDQAPAPVLAERHVEDLDREEVAGSRIGNRDRAGQDMRTNLWGKPIDDALVLGQDGQPGLEHLGPATDAGDLDGVAGGDGQDGRKAGIEIAPMDRVGR
jgi:hypothetical protein